MKVITNRGRQKNTRAQRRYDDKRSRLSAMIKNWDDKHKAKVTLPSLAFMKEGRKL